LLHARLDLLEHPAHFVEGPVVEHVGAAAQPPERVREEEAPQRVDAEERGELVALHDGVQRFVQHVLGLRAVDVPAQKVDARDAVDEEGHAAVER